MASKSLFAFSFLHSLRSPPLTRSTFLFRRRPVTFVCRNRSGTQTFFSVSFEITDAEPAKGDGVKKEVAPSSNGNGKAAEEDEVEISDEID